MLPKMATRGQSVMRLLSLCPNEEEKKGRRNRPPPKGCVSGKKKRRPRAVLEPLCGFGYLFPVGEGERGGGGEKERKGKKQGENHPPAGVTPLMPELPSGGKKKDSPCPRTPEGGDHFTNRSSSFLRVEGEGEGRRKRKKRGRNRRDVHKGSLQGRAV